MLSIPFQERQPQDPTAEQKLLAQVDGGISQLLEEMQQGKSDRLERYLEFSARFHRYSVHNQLLIYMQRPQATFVAGYRKWQAMGYQVAKGEKGIRILAPRIKEVKDPESEGVRQIVYFVPVSVFDISQLANLDEKPLPLFFTPLPNDQSALYARLLQIVQAGGIHVTETPLGLTQGASMGHRIAIRDGLDSRNKFLTLLHEYTHELLHQKRQGKEYSPQARECQAEAVSFVVAHHFGIHNPFSADYLQYWGNSPTELLAELDIVRQTAASIIQRMEEPKGEVSLAEEQGAEALPGRSWPGDATH